MSKVETKIKKGFFKRKLTEIARTIKRTTVSRVIIFLFLTLYSLTMVLSLVWVVLASLKSHNEITLTNVMGLPKDWLFTNYATAFKRLGDGKTGLFDMLFNSIWFSFGSSFLSVFICSLTAYVMSKYEFKGKKFLYGIFLVAMMLPVYGSFASNYKLTVDMRIYNTPLMLVTACAGYGSTMLILLSSFDSLSWEYAEAAEIDGAGHYRIFFQVMLPLMKPVLFALGIIGFITAWNNYMLPITYMPKYPTISSGLYTFKDIAMLSFNIPSYYAGVVLSFIPTLLLFIFFNKTIIESVSIGGLKG